MTRTEAPNRVQIRAFLKGKISHPRRQTHIDRSIKIWTSKYICGRRSAETNHVQRRPNFRALYANQKVLTGILQTKGGLDLGQKRVKEKKKRKRNVRATNFFVVIWPFFTLIRTCVSPYFSRFGGIPFRYFSATKNMCLKR